MSELLQQSIAGQLSEVVFPMERKIVTMADTLLEQVAMVEIPLEVAELLLEL